MLRYEFRRIIYNKKFLYVLGLGVAILLFSGYMEAKDYLFIDFSAPDLQTPEQQENMIKLVSSGLNRYNVFANTLNFYIMIIPIICSVFSLTYDEDIKNEMIKNINIRISNKKYVINKILVNSIMGGLLVTIPLIIVIIIVNLFFKGTVYDFSANGAYGGYFASIFTNNTTLYYFIFLLIEFGIGMVYANIALAISTKVKSKISILLAPFIFYNGFSIICNAFNKNIWSPAYITQFYYFPEVNLKIIIIELTIIFSISSVIFLYFARKKNFYE